MHPPQSPATLAESFLRHLQAEEQLLRDALASLSDVYESLRQGDLAAVAVERPQQQQLALALQAAEATRSNLARDLAQAVELPVAERLTLTAIAERLPEPWAAELRASRERLTAVTGELSELHRRNANLIGHLRSYFRGVLTALTVPDVPVRYGSSGGRLNPGSSAAIQARG
jgi:FlgN protein